MNQSLLLSVLASLSDGIHHLRYATVGNQDKAIAKDLEKALKELNTAHTKLSHLCDDKQDHINPIHYQGKGVECIQITRCFGFAQGNAIKYAWRAGQKDSFKQDMQKCLWYINECKTNPSEPSTQSETAKALFLEQVYHKEVEHYLHHHAILKAIIEGDWDRAEKLISVAFYY